MKSTKIIASFTLAASIGIMAADVASALPRRLRDREAATAATAATVKAAETDNGDQSVHQTNKETRDQKWDNASPNQKAATYNVAKSAHTKNETQKADVEAAATEKASADKGVGRRRRR